MSSPAAAAAAPGAMPADATTAAKKESAVASLLSFTTFGTIKWEHMVAGVTGGVVASMTVHPLDLLKIRLAVDDGTTKRPSYWSLRHAAASVVRQEGFRGLYKGVSPNVVGAGTAWGLYFLFYNTAKFRMQKGDTTRDLGPLRHVLCASQAGVLTILITNPIWVVKTRLCLQYGRAEKMKLDPTKMYSGMLDALVKIARHEGLPGLYKGLVPGLWGVSHGAVQFMAYEELKSRYNRFRHKTIDAKLGTVAYLTFAALSKLIAALTTYPYQLIRTRLQDHHSEYTGAIQCIRQTFRNEGVLAFYKGLTPSLMRVVPATAITFLVYEEVVHFLGDFRRQ